MIICKHMQKYTKIQASAQHGLYLFTCEIHSFNSCGEVVESEKRLGDEPPGLHGLSPLSLALWPEYTFTPHPGQLMT